MTAVALSRRETDARGNGGVAARRAVMRWSWRLFRREWRQQVIVLLLLTFSTAAALFAAIAVYHVPDSSDASFGRADHRITLTSDDPSALAAATADLTAQYAPVEVIGHTPVPVPGSVDSIDLRAQDPHGRFGAPMLALREGRYPTNPNEVAVTDAAAALLKLHIGDTPLLAGTTRTVVGVVENPANLDDEFVLAPSIPAEESPSVTLLLNSTDHKLGDRPNSILRFTLTDDKVTALAATRGSAERGAAAIAVLALDTVALLLVSLVAAAAFVVVAQRRQRQLGMLAAIGATNRHLRLVMIAHGFAVGVAAAIAGNMLALSAWLAFSPRLESAVGHRIDRADIPWWVVAAGTLLALVTTTATAWWPARTVARVPIVRALSGRPPAPTRVRRSAALAIGSLAVGVTLLVFGIHKNGHPNPAAVIFGPIAIVIGILFLSPLAIRLFTTTAPLFPVAVRLALRDLARRQARAGSALAAISLGLGIAFTAIIVTAAATPPASAGNLSNRQLLFRIGNSEIIPERTPAQLADMQATLDRFASGLDHAQVFPLDGPINASASIQTPFDDPNGDPGHEVIGLGERIDHGIQSSGFPYVASPELLTRAGVDPAAIEPDAEVITPKAGAFVFVDPSAFTKSRGPDDIATARVHKIHDPGYSDAPKTFITEAAMSAHGWTKIRAGWFIESGRPLSAQQRADARDLAASTGMTVVSRDARHDLAVTRTTATIAGMVLALGILAMTIGLVRGEASRDLQTLTATGATSHVRRVITAATAGALAILGATLGLAGAYAALVAGYSDDLHPLTRIPWAHLVTIVVGLPVLAATAGWILAGREPRTFTRQALD